MPTLQFISHWQELLDGILMSDGNLTIPGQCRAPRYQQTCKEPTFLEWVASWLPTSSRVTGPHRSGQHNYWLLSTRTDAVYTPIYHRWYPQGKKRLPHDLEVTPSLLLTEYLGDGHLLANAKKKIQRVELGTYGFAKDDLEAFVIKLQEHQLAFRLVTKNSLHLRGALVAAFLEYIGSCPVPALAYKWKNIEVQDLAWRRIVSVEEQQTRQRLGKAVLINLECGHYFRRPLSRLRSPNTGKMICILCSQTDELKQ